MKKIILLGILLIILGLFMMEKDSIIQFYQKYIFPVPDVITLGDKNSYYRNYDFDFVQNTDNFSPTNKQDILNIYYTVINAGKESFTFYCPKEYSDCLTEVGVLAKDQTMLSHINNFVHPYNSFKHIETEYDNMGKVTLKIQKSYTQEQISIIEQKISEIKKQITLTNPPTRNDVRMIHDYIIDHSKYDSKRSDENIIRYQSDIAYGPLLEGYGLCGGYTDAMQLFLEKMNIKSFKVSSDKHVWNAVFLDNQWYHLDLTWDDPVTPDNTDAIDYSFFLISTDQLSEIEQTQHTFDLHIYQEMA